MIDLFFVLAILKMRYSANADKSCFIAYKLEDNKRVKVAKIEIRLFDADIMKDPISRSNQLYIHQIRV